jgi:hypothetical protein
MLEPEESKAIDKGMRVNWLIWAGMLYSLFAYVLVCYLLTKGGQHIVRDEEWSDSAVQLLRNVLYGVALLELILSSYLKKNFLKVRPLAHKKNIVKQTSHLNQPPYMGQYNVAVIILLVISDSIGIYGLLLFSLRGDFRTLYTFIIISALAVFFYRPKRKEMEKLAMAYKKQAGASPEIDRSGVK